MTTNSATILLIDDEDEMREALAEVLEDEGHIVAQAREGKMGLEYLRSNPHPKLILLDFMMPVMNGEEFCAHLNQDPNLNSLPVVLVTAASIAAKTLETMKVSGLVHKPIRIEDFLNLVKKYCSYN
jgi:CheY-like chemotaxis protein